MTELRMLAAEARGDPAGWAARHRDLLAEAVLEHGAIGVRGLDLHELAQVRAVYRALADDLMVEREATANRTDLGERLYSATPWPPNQRMCMHHELSYRLEFPGLLLFGCLAAGSSGGATGVADSAAVLRELPAELVERLDRDGWLLVRNYGGDVGGSIGAAFGTEDRAAVADYCNANAIEFEWRPGGGLRTVQRRSAIVRHPVTGQRCWFNEIGFLSEWTLDPAVRNYLIEVYGPDALPFGTYFGDGEPVGESLVRSLDEAHDAVASHQSWQPGDLLLVDNVRMAHDRAPFRGPRQILVALANPVSLADCSPTIELGSGQLPAASQRSNFSSES